MNFCGNEIKNCVGKNIWNQLTDKTYNFDFLSIDQLSTNQRLQFQPTQSSVDLC
jgi:hypothetical protein